MICRAAFLCLLLSANSAWAAADWSCATPGPDCREVFIVYSAWHAAIVLRARDIDLATVPEVGDLPRARFLEFSWGDENYFRDPHTGVLAALKAALWSSGSVVHVVAVNDDLRNFYPGAAVIELRFSRAAYVKLVQFISASFTRPAPGVAATPSPGLFAYSRFYPSPRRFSLIRTCNRWVADALEAAGVPIAPSYVITAGQLAEQVGKLTGP
jgi:uncharacterized protein (TIGR02117 family)